MLLLSPRIPLGHACSVKLTPIQRERRRSGSASRRFARPQPCAHPRRQGMQERPLALALLLVRNATTTSWSGQPCSCSEILEAATIRPPVERATCPVARSDDQRVRQPARATPAQCPCRARGSNRSHDAAGCRLREPWPWASSALAPSAARTCSASARLSPEVRSPNRAMEVSVRRQPGACAGAKAGAEAVAGQRLSGWGTTSGRVYARRSVTCTSTGCSSFFPSS